jgi:hypothetical protein
MGFTVKTHIHSVPRPGDQKEMSSTLADQERPRGVGGGGGCCGVSANEYSCAHGAQIKFGNLQ